jgi:N6-adenosine-specific RNA methylase IME4
MSIAAVDTWELHALRASELEDQGEDQKWAACAEYETAAGEVGNRQVARKVGKSETHIRYMRSALRTKVRTPGVTFADAYAKAKQKQPPDHDPVDLAPAMGTYRTLVVDPPWQYDNRGTRGAAEDHYPTERLEWLAAMELPADDDAHLYLWTTNAFLRDAFDLVEEWGFTYKAHLAWVKPQMGMGNYFRISHEHVLFGIRGKLKTLRRDAVSWFEAPRGRHSAKPDAFYQLVESCSPGPYIDLFNRDGGKLFRRPGWDAWGNEA